MKNFKLRKYKKEFPYSYTLGMAPTVELLQKKPEVVLGVFVHPKYKPQTDGKDIFAFCKEAGVECVVDEKAFNRVAAKENVFVLGVFEKFTAPIAKEKPHVVLVNPSDAGNLGTIIRTGIGFGFHDFVIVEPAVDIFDPRVIRASMGAVFYARFWQTEDFTTYMSAYKTHALYPFMLDGSVSLKEVQMHTEQPFSLVFGNEATGLSAAFHDYGTSVVIKQSSEVDSFNLAIAFGIAAYTFSKFK